jgi:class 3 adenylate cyclase/YHS domain-containing protein
MQFKIAILMADLSGYTALTEIHGAETAATLVGKFMELVKRSLVGDCRLHERVGDQVVIVSSSAEQLAYTATILFQETHKQEGFLPLHGGLHFGEIVEKNGGYYGSTINATARIMADAGKGKLLCSREFQEQLPGGDSFVFVNQGPKKFKNLSQPVHLYEMSCCIDNIQRVLVIDPICRMLINEKSQALLWDHNGEQYYFCSESCREIFRNSTTQEMSG